MSIRSTLPFPTYSKSEKDITTAEMIQYSEKFVHPHFQLDDIVRLFRVNRSQRAHAAVREMFDFVSEYVVHNVAVTLHRRFHSLQKGPRKAHIRPGLSNGTHAGE